MKQIRRVIRRSQQGVTSPFYCEDEDGKSCFVKGSIVGYRGLCCEWIGGRMAQALGLPIPRFGFVEVPELLIAGSAIEDIRQLGSGIAFASYEEQNDRDPIWEDLQLDGEPEKAQAQRALYQRIVLFDWWTCNPDRVLGVKGGNPNMLWSEVERRLWIIDHNLCFSPDHSNMPDFWNDHAFRDFGRDWTACKEELLADLQRVRAQVDHFWEELPEKWLYPAEDDSATLSLEEIDLVLARMDEAGFWKPEPQ